MSLFKVCHFWNIQSPETQKKYDSFSLHCSRLALQENEKDYIIVGSHTGHLGVYQPNVETEEDATWGAFKPTSVVLETKLDFPILQIISGKFSTASNAWAHLAILHPLKLCVYVLNKVDGVAEHGDQTKLQLIYEYQLTKYAFSICKGNFGGVKGREFLCVNHMDSSLRFFEQDGISIECQLPDDRAIPNQFLYIPRTDSFVTVSPGWDVECFRYQDLTQSEGGSKGLTPIWTFCIGECPIDMAVHQISNTDSVIVILGEHNLYCLSDSGRSRFIKRLNFTPVCFFSFIIGWYWEPDSRLMISIASDSGSLILYDNYNLVWAAQLPEIPVAITRANFKELSGAIVSLGEEGNVFVGYLGSEPQIFKVPPLKQTDMDFEKVQKELEELEKEIKSSMDVTDIALINAAVERDMQTNVAVVPKLENSTFPVTFTMPNENLPKVCQVSVSIKCETSIDQLQIHFNVHPPLKCSNPMFFKRDLIAGSIEKSTTFVYLETPFDPPDLTLYIMISFINKQSIPRVIERHVPLPMELVWQTNSPQKEGKYKITFAIEKLNLSQIFNEFNLEKTAQVIGLTSQYTDACVTIVQAKSSSRFRIQSDNLFAASSIFSTIVERLAGSMSCDKNKFIADTNRKQKFTTQYFIPVDEITKNIDEHSVARDNVKQCMKELETRCGQLRLIERRLLVKIQDRSPNALGGITNLLKVTHTNLVEQSMKLKNAQLELKRKQLNLSSVISMAKNVIKFLEVPPKTIDEFVAALYCPVYDWTHQGWEEMIYPSLEVITNSGPLCKNKNANFDELPTITAGDFEVHRFKKQLTSLFDRISKLTTNNQSSNTAATTTTTSTPSIKPSKQSEEESSSGEKKNYDDGDINVDDDKYHISNNDESTTVAIKQKTNGFGRRNSDMNNDLTTTKTTEKTTTTTTTTSDVDDSLEIQRNLIELNENDEINEETSDWTNDLTLANDILKF